MKPSELFKKVFFYDSEIDALVYSSATGELRLQIELANYMQEDYQEDDPDNLNGELILRGVKAIKFYPEPLQIPEDGSISAQILRFETIERASQDEFEDIILVLFVIHFPTRTHTTVVVNITASEAEWQISP
jgi:hypothetical protein